MKNTLTKIDNIKELYNQIEHKTNFTIEVGTYFKKSPQSLRVHWFGNFWSIPDKYQDELITLLQNKIANQ